MELWILEDEPDIASILAAMAEIRGLRPLVIRSMEEAWRILVRKPVPPACVISDYNLQDGCAKDWIEEVRKFAPRAKIICYTASAKEALFEQFLGLRVQLVEKPTKLSDLFALLAEDSCD